MATRGFQALRTFRMYARNQQVVERSGGGVVCGVWIKRSRRLRADT